jgi:chloramphenicol-sensitive protein RarD
LLAPFAAALIGWRAAHGVSGLGRDTTTTTLLLLAGVITAVPLIWFAHGVRNLRLATMGLIQFVTPTLQFLFAVLLFDEPFTSSPAIAFGCIWAALAIFTSDAILSLRKAQGAVSAPLRGKKRDQARHDDDPA